MIHRRALVLLALAVLTGTALPENPGPPDPPTEFRRISVAPIPGAPQIIEQLKHESDSASLRRELVSVYEKEDYLGASRFFENTARELLGDALIVESVTNDIAWTGSRPRSHHADEVLRHVNRLNGEFRYAEAAATARRDIEEHGTTLQLAIEWSHAILRLITKSPEKVSPEALEVALRIYLTALEEKVPKPIAIGHSQALGYRNLARVFARIGDSVSCRTAIALGKHHSDGTGNRLEFDDLLSLCESKD